MCEIQKDSLPSGSKVLIVDDLLATGGTLKAAEDLIAKVEGSEVAASFVIFDIPVLKGGEKLKYKFVTAVSM